MNSMQKIPDYAYAENREMQLAEIPFGTKVIGKHAFYNCRSLDTLVLPHGGIEIEDGAFKNCSSLRKILLKDGNGSCTCLKDILYDMNQEITVEILYNGKERAMLLFPHYEYEYIANEPARVFSEIGYGAGYIYQQCFFDSQIDYKRYDSLWSTACVSEDLSVLARILSYRLRYPFSCGESAQKSYWHYWETHKKELLSYYMEQSDMESLHFFLDSASMETLALAKQLANEAKRPELISYLLDLEKKKTPKPLDTFSRFSL